MVMFNRQMNLIAAFVAVLAVVVGAGGCSSSSNKPAESKKAVQGFQSTQQGIAKAQTVVDNTNKSLTQLTVANGDLQKSYNNYTSQVAQLDKSAQDAKKRADSMRARVKDYTAKWEKEVASMNDPTIQKSMTERRAAVQQNFQKVQTATAAARDAYQPYMAQLKEIQKALSMDLTPATVQSMKPAIDKAVAQGATLKQALTQVQAELTNITGGMSAAGGVAAGAPAQK